MRVLSIALAASALLACTGEIGDVSREPGEDPFAPPEALPFEPFDTVMQRLTVQQYQRSIRDVLGDVEVPSDLEPDTTISGFVSIGSSRTTISPTGVEKYEEAAYAVAEQALAPERRDSLVPCEPVGVDDPSCAEAFVGQVGRRLWRRPLTTEETGRYVAVARQAATTLDDFYASLEFALAGLLQSPNFLFRVEIGEPDPSDAELRRYSDWEMASRLSYVLWNTTPDDELLDAAERGELTSDAGLEAQVTRLLAHDNSRAAVRSFFRELLVLDHLADVEKSESAYPGFTASFRESAAQETLALIESYVVDEDRDYRELFTTYDTFVNDELATHYALEGEYGDDLERVTLPVSGGRRGLLGHASILSIYAHDEKTSAALRGRFVRQVLLCGNIPDPPDDVSTTFPPSDAPTLRERVEQHLMNEGCANCHALMDPIGLGLENFDAVGAWRDRENGALIDPSGIVDGAEFADAADLGRIVAEHPKVGECLARSAYRYAVGEVEGPHQAGEIARLTEGFEAEGHRVRALLAAIVTSPGFRQAGEQR